MCQDWKAGRLAEFERNNQIHFKNLTRPVPQLGSWDELIRYNFENQLQGIEKMQFQNAFKSVGKRISSNLELEHFLSIVQYMGYNKQKSLKNTKRAIKTLAFPRQLAHYLT